MASADFPETRSLLAIIVTYVLSYGLTANLITPAQQIILSEETVFASLLYLPHGVRVLSVMLYRWRAVPALIAGNILAGYLFAPPGLQERDLAEYLLPAIMASSCAWIAFEIFRLFGKDFYATADHSPGWQQIVLVGAVASVLNSLGQAILLGRVFDLVDNHAVYLMFAAGDLLGLLASMLVLMLVFRGLRRWPGKTGSDKG